MERTRTAASVSRKNLEAHLEGEQQRLRAHGGATVKEVKREYVASAAAASLIHASVAALSAASNAAMVGCA